jgi:hypothetical protein
MVRAIALRVHLALASTVDPPGSAIDLDKNLAEAAPAAAGPGEAFV